MMMLSSGTMPDSGFGRTISLPREASMPSFSAFHNEITPTIKTQIDKVWQDRAQQPNIVRDVITETLEPITRQAIEQRQIIEREDIARRSGRPIQYPSNRELPPLRPITEALEPTEEGGRLPYKEVRQIVGFVMYPLEMIFIGGFVGGFLWGALGAVSLEG